MLSRRVGKAPFYRERRCHLASYGAPFGDYSIDLLQMCQINLLSGFVLHHTSSIFQKNVLLIVILFERSQHVSLAANDLFTRLLISNLTPIKTVTSL